MISPCVNMGIRGDFSTLRNARQAAIGFMTHKGLGSFQNVRKVLR